MIYYTDTNKSARPSSIQVIAIPPCLRFLFTTFQPCYKFLVILSQTNKLRSTFLQLHRTLIQQLPQLLIFHGKFFSNNDLLMSQGFIFPSKALNFFKKSIFFMGKVGNLIFIFTGQVDYFCLLFVIVLGQVINHLFFCIENLFHASAFRFKSFCQLFYLLVFQKRISVSLILDFLKLHFV